MTSSIDNKYAAGPARAPVRLNAHSEGWFATGLEVPFEPGNVWLTGAGPGDPGLLTLHAMHALKTADIIFFDALVSDEVLALVPDDVELVYVGKRGGKPSPKQGEITNRLIESARAGRRVLRLKGGDPFVFGRGAEEALELAASGIACRIIPGVTAGIGGLAYAGVPVTHRDYNQSVALITAHDATGGLAKNIDWDALAKGCPVLVIFMGFRLIGAIADCLIAAGRPGTEPVAVVSRATTPDQRTIVTSLANAAKDVEQANLEPPAMIVVGEIVKLRDALRWVSTAAADMPAKNATTHSR